MVFLSFSLSALSHPRRTRCELCLWCLIAWYPSPLCPSHPIHVVNIFRGSNEHLPHPTSIVINPQPECRMSKSSYVSRFWSRWKEKDAEQEAVTNLTKPTLTRSLPFCERDLYPWTSIWSSSTDPCIGAGSLSSWAWRSLCSLTATFLLVPGFRSKFASPSWSFYLRC